MPELPEVEALTRRLDERARGRTVTRLEVAAISALKTYEPPVATLRGATLHRVSRRGKYVCFEIGEHVLVLHLARGGWVRWWETLTTNPGRPSRGPLALRVGLAEGDGFDVTEMGREKRLAVWVVRDPSEVDGIATLGPEPLDPALTEERLGRLLARERGDLKHALSHQSLIAGVGNAYSDEVLHAARLSQFKPAAKLDPDELGRLHAALVGTVGAAVERAARLDLAELKDGKRQHMAVHGRSGAPCPVCGDTVREVSYADRSLQYCPTCQTGGRVLADRRLSRLLK